MQRAKAEYNKHLYFEEAFWQQKVGYDYFVNGDKSTKFFHSLVKGGRQKLKVNRIQNSHGDWRGGRIYCFRSIRSFSKAIHVRK